LPRRKHGYANSLAGSIALKTRGTEGVDGELSLVNSTKDTHRARLRHGQVNKKSPAKCGAFFMLPSWERWRRSKGGNPPGAAARRSGYLPLVSTFCFSSSFIFLTVASWLVMPVVSVVVAGGLALGTEVCAGDVVAGCRSGWRIRLGGHLLNVPKQDARNQRRERRHFCVHHALLSEN